MPRTSPEPTRLVATPVTRPVAHHGEGPVWSPGWGGLRFVDLEAGDVLTLQEDGTVARRHVGRVAAALRPRRAGGAVVAIERGFLLEEPDGTLARLPPLWEDESVRMNDGGCDPDGRFWCGTMAYDTRPGAGTLYRLDADHRAHAVLDGLTISNGLGWTPDGARAYYVDTPTQRIDLFDYDRDKGLTRRRPFVHIPPEAGHPDGLAVDAEGGVWVALYGGRAVRRHLPDGTLDAIVAVDARQPTACTFGGPDLRTLYITTSRQNLAPGDDPLAGSLFAVDVDVQGLPAATYDG